MYRHTYIEELIEDAQNAEISMKNIEILANIHDVATGETIRVPYWDVVSKYKDVLESYIVELTMGDNEVYKYKYKPKMLSQSLYKTTELWSVILSLNNMISVVEFTPPPIIKVYEPKGFLVALNEILIAENKIVF